MRGSQMDSLRTVCSHSGGLYTQRKCSSKQDYRETYSRDISAVPMAKGACRGRVLFQWQ